jgi:hypothetical protein
MTFKEALDKMEQGCKMTLPENKFYICLVNGKIRMQFPDKPYFISNFFDEEFVRQCAREDWELYGENLKQ